ncbi:hypothetical protein GGR53DRAFT_466646 [Hypoxylon sp. FL1150]|nr:hypothetical protein GGR53DRAFT_466646 [Hypoxylon sp. FL1150]
MSRVTWLNSFLNRGQGVETTGERAASVSIASAKVSSTAAQAVLNAVKSQPSDHATIANLAAKFILSAVELMAKVAVKTTLRVRSEAENVARSRKTGGRVITADLEAVATATSDFARAYVTNEAPKRIKLATYNNAHNAAVTAAAVAAAVDVVNAVASVVESNIAAIAHTTDSVTLIIKLIQASAGAAIRTSRTVADAFVLADEDEPPAYEESSETSGTGWENRRENDWLTFLEADNISYLQETPTPIFL